MNHEIVFRDTRLPLRGSGTVRAVDKPDAHLEVSGEVGLRIPEGASIEEIVDAESFRHQVADADILSVVGGAGSAVTVAVEVASHRRRVVREVRARFDGSKELGRVRDRRHRQPRVLAHLARRGLAPDPPFLPIE